MSGDEAETRSHEWFVPGFGSRRFRLFVGMTFLPYTLMNASYVVIGSALAPTVHWDRVIAIAMVYVLAVGIASHALDALAPNRPWGAFLSDGQLLALAIGSLAPALAIGAFYGLSYAPILLLVGAAELFFLFAYNLELFGGLFHTKLWFAFAWGLLPALAGYASQTNTIDVTALGGGFFGLLTAYVEISASRPYKMIMMHPTPEGAGEASKLESVLKGDVAAVLSVAVLLVFLRASV